MNSLENTIKLFYKSRDKSHDWNHVQNVKNNSIMLMKEQNFDKNNIDIVIIASLAHDIWDHKYLSSKCEGEKLKLDFIKILRNYDYDDKTINIIISIIDNISFSKEIVLRNKNKKLELPKNILKLRNIVSDADKLEALGEEGIQRMIDYRIYKDNTDIMKDIRSHFNNKLKYMVRDNYIINSVAKKLGMIKIKEMEVIINDELVLKDFINNYILKSD
jgi:HD superfamily phosphodiesterase